MMNSFGGFGPFMFLGFLGNLAFISGIILLLGWAVKHLPAYKLKQIAVWLIIGGVLTLFLSGLFMMWMPPYVSDDDIGRSGWWMMRR